MVVSTQIGQVIRGDAGPFAARMPKLPILNFIEGPYWYRTTADTVEAMSPTGLARAARLFASVIEQVADQE